MQIPILDYFSVQVQRSAWYMFRTIYEHVHTASIIAFKFTVQVLDALRVNEYQFKSCSTPFCIFYI